MPTTVPNPVEALHNSLLNEIKETLKEAGAQDWEIVSTRYLGPPNGRRLVFQITTRVEMPPKLMQKVCDAVEAVLVDERKRVMFLVDRDVFVAPQSRYHTGIICTMSGGGAASVPYPGAGGPSSTTLAPNMSDDEFKDFNKIFEKRLLPAIIEKLHAANIGAQVYFLKRKFICVNTREEAPSSLKQEIGCVVAETLGPDLCAKVSLEFGVGEVKRT
ncbi:hypothetical protein GGR58DRAFT_501900 [Xylaria digitata]|nr:hypothetical protein GGR58DRAFT_501900 [Xylaria digitata]